MIEKLKESLASWAKVPTWHTSHPLDEKRFNTALAEAIRHLGTDLDAGHFRKAISDIASEYHGLDLNNQEVLDKIDEMAQKAEDICSFVKDNDIRL